MKIAEVTFREEVACDAKWLRRGETVDAGFFLWVLSDGVVQLAVPAVGGVEWLKRDELGWVGG